MDTVKAWFEIVVASVACVAWFVRLEAKGLATSRELLQQRESLKEVKGENMRLRTEQREFENRIYDKLSIIEKSLAKIEGRILFDSRQP